MDKRRIIVIGAILVFVIVLVAAFLFGRQPQPRKATLNFWGVIDESDVWNELIANFNSQFPHITVNYIKKSPANFERQLLEALAIGRGPDIFTIPRDWLPAHKNKLYPAPDEILNFQSFKDNFVDAAIGDFSSEQKIYALPLFVDTLALYYNKDLFNKAGLAQPPKNWDDFQKYVIRLTVRSEASDILQSGAALGTAKNIEKAYDILRLLILQSKIDMVSLNGGEKALAFYTQFAQPNAKLYTWNSRLPNSLDSFSQGKVAMIFDYASARERILNKNPNLNFAAAPMPQLKDAEKFINYADYWGLTVTLQSRNKLEAWQFIKFMTDRNVLYNYLQKAQRPSPRRDLSAFQQEDPNLKIFATQSLSAVSWYPADKLALDRIFEEMIESALGGSPLQEVIVEASKKINQLIQP